MTDEKTKNVEKTEEKSLVERLFSPDQWVRFVFMFLFAIAFCLLSYITGAVVLLQFVCTLVMGKDNEKLRHFGSSVSIYISQIVQFLTYNSENKPFPFNDWPEANKPREESDNQPKQS